MPDPTPNAVNETPVTPEVMPGKAPAGKTLVIKTGAVLSWAQVLVTCAVAVVIGIALIVVINRFAAKKA